MTSMSLSKKLVRFFAIAAVCLTAANASAVVTWDETIDGPLSNDRLAPTAVDLVPGINSMLGTTVSGDREYVTMSIPSGQKLSQIILESYVGIDGTAFIGVQSGTTFTEPPTGTNVANLLGYAHFGPGVGNDGLDILPEIGAGGGAIGFAPPLIGSDYTFWIQQTGANATTYRLDFVVVPEPGSALLLSVGGLAMLLAAARRRTHA
jgi:hypothetical protein